MGRWRVAARWPTPEREHQLLFDCVDQAVFGEQMGFDRSEIDPERIERWAVAINAQKFTKTANIWGVSNNSKGTNSNRIVLFRKPV